MMPEIYPAASVSEFGVVVLYQASRELLRAAWNGDGGGLRRTAGDGTGDVS